MDRTDAGVARVTLASLCDRYLATVQSQSGKTLKRKNYIAARLKEDFPGGADVAANKVVRPQVSAWLAGYRFGSASHNLFLEFIRAVFALAVADRVLVLSPVEEIKTRKREMPIRKTPTLDKFRAILASIRGQQFADTAKPSRAANRSKSTGTHASIATLGILPLTAAPFRLTGVDARLVACEAPAWREAHAVVPSSVL